MSSDPNGTRWAASGKNFGKNLLKKSGWSEGTGLGKEQEGTTTHVKVSRKDDVMGIGYKAGVQDTWSAQSVGFADVLDRLKTTKSSSMIVVDDSDEDVAGPTAASPTSPDSKPSSPTESRHYKMYAKRNALKTELLRSNGDEKKQEILGRASSSGQRKRSRDEDEDMNTSTLTSPLLTRLMMRHPKHEPKPSVGSEDNRVRIVKPNPRPPKCTESPFLAH